MPPFGPVAAPTSNSPRPPMVGLTRIPDCCAPFTPKYLNFEILVNETIVARDPVFRDNPSTRSFVLWVPPAKTAAEPPPAGPAA